ncbi:MAG: hypothetical protein AAF658_05845 [Myxococcota bacterium]
MKRYVYALAGCWVLLACDAPLVDRALQQRFELDEGLLSQPTPSVFRANNRVSAIPALADAVERLSLGDWSDAALLVPFTTEITNLPEDSLDRRAPIFLLRLTEVPQRVAVEYEPQKVEDSLVVVVRPTDPADGLPGRYALVLLDDLLARGTNRLGRAQLFHDAWEDNDDADSTVRTVLLELRAALIRDGIDLATVGGAAIFDVGP